MGLSLPHIIVLGTILALPVLALIGIFLMLRKK